MGGQVADWTVPHSRADKPGGTTGVQDRQCKPGLQGRQNKASEPLAVKICGGCRVGETASLIGEFVGETHSILETNPPTQNQHQKGLICLWVAGEVIKSGMRAEQVALFPPQPLLYIQHYNAAKWVALP